MTKKKSVPAKRSTQFDDKVIMYDGTILRFIHAKNSCLGRHCGIHNPSDHPLVASPFYWDRSKRRMYRVCPHGIHHPDPDDVAYNLLTYPGAPAEALAELTTHDCDDCCKEDEE